MCKPVVQAIVLITLVTLVSACEPDASTVTSVPTTIPAQPTKISVLPTATPASEPSPTPGELPVEVIRNVPYVADGDPLQKLDIYRPRGLVGPFPTLFAIHGGGGNKSQMAMMGYYFAKRGYVVVVINHRQMPQHRYPVPVQDCFCALAWVHAHAAEYGLDPAYLVALGHSAGGTLAAMLGVVGDAVANDGAVFVTGCPYPLPAENWVQGVVTFTGTFDYARAAGRAAVLREYLVTYLGATLDEDPNTWAQASPGTWVDGSEPPFLLVHGLADRTIPPAESESFAATLERAGVDVELLLVPDADHGQITRDEQSLQAVEAFCTRLWGQP